jgi:hypothetical protein
LYFKKFLKQFATFLFFRSWNISGTFQKFLKHVLNTNYLKISITLLKYICMYVFKIVISSALLKN